jgi:phthalate 4,5-dioxygenase oxygenase subunit
MLSQEDNELLTRTGPGTPMGELMRRFWMPAMLASELPAPDCPPVRLRLLGEDLVAFRDTNGRVGILDEHCPHRRASLFFGRNEECGIRCCYHGWKFDVEGNCVELPSEPPESNMKAKVRIKSYLAREAGGFVWVYMGPKERPAAFPECDFMQYPASHRYASRWIQDCNWLQSLEGEIDSSHVSFLHRTIDRVHEKKTALTGQYFRENTWPRWTVHNTDYGMMAGACRTVDGGQNFLRVNQFLLPFFTMIAPVPGNGRVLRAWMPCDDTTHCVAVVTYRPERPLTEAEVASWRNGNTAHRKTIPGTLLPEANIRNDYLVDREVQRTSTFTGIHGIRAQDAAMTESQGTIADRTKEYLGSSDTAIIAARKRLLLAARALMRGEEPATMGDGSLFNVKPYTIMLDPSVPIDLMACMGRPEAVS